MTEFSALGRSALFRSLARTAFAATAIICASQIQIQAETKQQAQANEPAPIALCFGNEKRQCIEYERLTADGKTTYRVTATVNGVQMKQNPLTQAQFIKAILASEKLAKELQLAGNPKDSCEDMVEITQNPRGQPPSSPKQICYNPLNKKQTALLKKWIDGN